jgi:hypothetical protein
VKRHPALWLAICLAIFYALLGNSRIDSGEGEAMLQVTRALAERGRVDLPAGILPPVEIILVPSTDTEIPYTFVGRDQRTYSKYGLGQSLAALPLYGLGMAWRAASDVSHAPRSTSLLLNGLLTAGTAAVLFILAQDLHFSKRSGVLLALVFALCTPAWPYTHTFFSEPVVTFCLTCAALGAVRFSQSGRARWLVLTGALLGLALLTRINALAALPAFGLYLCLTWRAQRSPFGLVVRQAALGLGALGIGVGLMLLYNHVRSGNPLDFGYHTSNWQAPFFVGLYGLTLSPGKGLLWYAPPVLLGLVGLRAFARCSPREALLFVGVLLGYLLFHSSHTYWEGGWCWGPRLILPALPLALLPAGSILDRPGQRQAIQLGLALVLTMGLLVQIPAVGSNYAHPLQKIYLASPDEFQTRVLYQAAYSPLIRQWSSLVEVTSNLRSSAARTQIADLVASTQPAQDTLLLTDSFDEALRLERQRILAYNLPDLWMVTGPWLRQSPRHGAGDLREAIP